MERLMTKGTVELSGPVIASIMTGRLLCELPDLQDALAKLTNAGPSTQWWGLANSRSIIAVAARNLLFKQLPFATGLTEASSQRYIDAFMTQYTKSYHVLNANTWAEQRPVA
jgi:hypothetical protein